MRYGSRFERRSPGGDTVYFCTTDSDGLVVSIIQSIYHDFGAAVIGGDTGIILQNRGSFFSLDEHHPNRLEPGKRTFHTIIPAMMVKDGRPVLAFGAMGGEGQPQTQAALVTRLVDFGYDVQQAIEAPRLLIGSGEGGRSRVQIEDRLPRPLLAELEGRGHTFAKVGRKGEVKYGYAALAVVNTTKGTVQGGADPRRSHASAAPGK